MEQQQKQTKQNKQTRKQCSYKLPLLLVLSNTPDVERKSFLGSVPFRVEDY
jgi:hypothetical protein